MSETQSCWYLVSLSQNQPATCTNFFFFLCLFVLGRPPRTDGLKHSINHHSYLILHWPALHLAAVPPPLPLSTHPHKCLLHAGLVIMLHCCVRNRFLLKCVFLCGLHGAPRWDFAKGTLAYSSMSEWSQMLCTKWRLSVFFCCFFCFIKHDFFSNFSLTFI